jgi:hypothetical protein
MRRGYGGITIAIVGAGLLLAAIVVSIGLTLFGIIIGVILAVVGLALLMLGLGRLWADRGTTLIERPYAEAYAARQPHGVPSCRTLSRRTRDTGVLAPRTGLMIRR